MPVILTVLKGLGFLGFLITAFRGFSRFDRLLAIFAARYPEDWAEMGHPPGYLTSPDHSERGIHAAIGRCFITFGWMRRSVPWIEGDDQAKLLHREYRRFALFSLIFWLVIGISMFAS